MNVGEILVDEGIITAQQLGNLLKPHRSISDWKLITKILSEGLSSEDHIMKVISRAAKLPYFADLRGLYVPGAPKHIERNVAYHMHIAPLFRIENTITCATVSPFDPQFVNLARRLAKKLEFIISTPSKILAALGDIYGR